MDEQWDGTDRRGGERRRDGGLTVSADEANVLIGEVRGLRDDVRRGKLYQILLGLALFGVFALGATFVIGYAQDNDQESADRRASRQALCRVLNEYVIARDEAGVRALLAASARTPEQVAQGNRGKSPEEIERDTADRARRLLILADVQSMTFVDGQVYAPRIDCISYVDDPTHVRFLSVPKSSTTTTVDG